MRESVFNALHSQGVIDGARIADLFAGSGAMGIEALSRGAEHVWFVETDRAALEVIDDNLDTLGFRHRATVLRSDVRAALVGDVLAELDVVLADPPYAFDDWILLSSALGPAVADDGILVVESGSEVALGPGWEKMRERSYGGTVITFAHRTGADA